MGGVGGPVALLLFLLCLPVWVSAPPSLLGLTSQLDCVAQWSPVPVNATRLILPFRLSESPARYSNKELKGMLVWSPNHCVSDAKREWGGPWSGPVLGAGLQLFLRSGLLVPPTWKSVVGALL